MVIHRLIIYCGFILLFSIAAGYPAVAQQIETPVNVQIPIFTKILSFDKSMRIDADSAITFAALYQSDVRYSDLVHDELFEYLETASEAKVFSSSIRYIGIDMATEKNLEETLTNRNVDVLYIAPLRKIEMQRILAVCRERSILTMTGVVEYMNAGVAVGVRTKRNRPEILINLPEAKAEGAEFSSRLLKLAKIIQ